MNEEQAPELNADDLGPGAMLARARVEHQLSIAEIAERLKYGARQIEALEADDYRRLPGTTFVRGMIRGYAKLVDVDPASALKALDRRHIPARVTVDLRTQSVPFPDGNRRATRLYVALSVLALIAIAVVLYEWQFVGPRMAPVPVATGPAVTPAPAAQPPVAAPVASEPAAAPERVAAPEPVAAPAQQGDRIEFEFLQESWVEVKDGGGKTLLSQLNPAGTRKAIEGSPPFSVIIGNAANVRVTYRNEPVDLKPYVRVEVARFTLE